MLRVLAMAALALALAAPAAATRAAAPTLKIVSTSPIIVKGSGFKVGERVRVVVTGTGASWTKIVHASAAHTFTARFTAATASRCGLVAAAFGSRGSRVATKPAEPECPQPIGP